MYGLLAFSDTFAQVAVTVIALFLVSESAGLRKDSLLNEGLKYRELTGQLPTIKGNFLTRLCQNILCKQKNSLSLERSANLARTTTRPLRSI